VFGVLHAAYLAFHMGITLVTYWTLCTQSEDGGKQSDCRPVGSVRFTVCHNMPGQCSVRLQVIETDAVA